MELTVDLQSALYDDKVLDTMGRSIYVETFGPDYDEGMFPPGNKGLWTRFLNKVDSDGIDYLTKKCAYRSADVRIRNDGQYLTFEFSRPILVKTGFQIRDGERTDVVSEVRYLRLECDYDFLYRRNCDQAREVEVRGKIMEMK